MRLHLLALVHLQLITEHTQRLLVVYLPQLFEMINERVTVDRFVVDVEPLQIILFRDGRHNAPVACVNLFLVYS